MKQTAIVLFLLCIMYLNINAQEAFIDYGKITFEKKVNLLRTFENVDLPQEAREKMQKYVSSNLEFYFEQGKSLYKAAKK